MTIIWRSKTQKAANPGKRILGTSRLTKNERDIADNFMTAIRELTATVDTSALTRALGSGSINNAVRSFDWGQFGSRLSENRLALLAQVTESGKASAKELAPVIGNFAFDVTDARAVAWAASRSGEKVVEISQTLQNEIRGMITSSFANQIDPREIAKELELKVGLFDRWGNAVTNSYNKNYSEFLAQGMSPGEAERRATELADAYRDRLISARAENIARTEVMTAANQGRLMSWQQAGDKGLVDLDASMKQWIAEGSACDICEGADAEGPIPVNDDWELDNGDTVDMPPGHPSCRCTAVLIPLEPGEGLDQPEEPEQTEGDGETANTSQSEEEVDDSTMGDNAYSPGSFTSDDAGAVFDRWSADIAELSENPTNAFLADTAQNGDQSLNAIQELQGFNDPPTLVSAAEWEQQVAANPDGIHIYRGIDDVPGGLSAAEATEQFRTGDNYSGFGVFGNGTYATNTIETADRYGVVLDPSERADRVLQMTMNPDARLISHNDAVQLRDQLLQVVADRTLPDSMVRQQWETVLSDVGRSSAMFGYDAIYSPMKSDTWYNLLNRTAVTVAERPL